MDGFARPYVVSWNLTYRCNLACEHCYLDAGGTPLVDTQNFADRSELGTAKFSVPTRGLGPASR